MRSQGFNPSTLAKRMSKSPVAGGVSTNVTAGDVPAKNPVVENDNGANKFKDGNKWTAQSWAAAGKTGRRPAHSFGKPRGGNPVKPLPALSNKGKKDFLNRGQSLKALSSNGPKKVPSPRMNALSKRLNNKGK